MSEVALYDKPLFCIYALRSKLNHQLFRLRAISCLADTLFVLTRRNESPSYSCVTKIPIRNKTTIPGKMIVVA